MNGVGLFDGFTGYQNHGEKESAALVRQALIVPDTNVLLSLYKYNPATREDMIRALASVGDRLFVPHQVVREFWRNRRRVITEHRDRIRNLQDAINKYPELVRQDVDRYRKITRDEDPLFAEGVSALANAVDALAERMESAIDRIVDPASPTSNDPVLQELRQLLQDKVQARPHQEVWDNMLATGLQRAEDKIPPGYMDADKTQSENAAGDYLVWAAATSEAISRGLCLVVITGDVKEDWWERSRSQLLGPRPELVHEFEALGGRSVSLLQPTDFLSLASTYLSVRVDPKSIENVADDEPREWDVEAIAELLRRLDEEGAWQADVLRAAARNEGGFLERSEIYRIAGRDMSQRLTGWTRPLARVAGKLAAEGYTEASIDDFLTSYYEANTLEEIEVSPVVAAMILAADEARE